MLKSFVILILTIVLLPIDIYAQVEDHDSLTNVETRFFEKEQRHISRATLYSAVLPGVGQIKNRKAWKVPVIYGIATGLVFSALNNNTNYSFFRENFLAEVDTFQSTTNIPNLNEAQLERRVDFFRRNRDFSYILLAVLYLVNVLDAHVDAHLRGFNVTENVSVDLKPHLGNNTGTTYVGLSLSLDLNRSENHFKLRRREFTF